MSLGRDPLAGLNHWKDINAVAGLLRVYFRELEDPLFPSSHYQEFIKASCKCHVVFLSICFKKGLMSIQGLRYCDYHLSKVRRRFVDEVLDLKLRCCRGQLCSFSTSQWEQYIVTCNFAHFTANDVQGLQIASGYEGSCL